MRWGSVWLWSNINAGKFKFWRFLSSAETRRSTSKRSTFLGSWNCFRSFMARWDKDEWSTLLFYLHISTVSTRRWVTVLAQSVWVASCEFIWNFGHFFLITPPSLKKLMDCKLFIRYLIIFLFYPFRYKYWLIIYSGHFSWIGSLKLRVVREG